MGDSDIGPGGDGTRGEVRAGFLPGDGAEMRRVGRGEIGGQADRQDMPQITVFHRTGMQFCPRNGGECSIPEPHGIGNRKVVNPQEMIGQGDEIIAFGLVPAAHFGRVEHAIGQGGMSVQIAPKKLAGGVEKGGHQGLSLHEGSPCVTAVRASFQSG